MAKKNTFYGATLPFNTLVQFYDPKNPGASTLSYFVLQPEMQNGDKADDDYGLICYAVDLDGNIMNGGNPINLQAAQQHKQEKGKKVRYANVYLYRHQLEKLMPNDTSTSDITFKPQRYKQTDYVAYLTETNNVSFASRTELCNPSPPATFEGSMRMEEEQE